jgi:hypothetical protein
VLWIILKEKRGKKVTGKKPGSVQISSFRKFILNAKTILKNKKKKIIKVYCTDISQGGKNRERKAKDSLNRYV